MNIANQGFPATRADLNNALQAIATNNSGTSEPSTTFANQWFYNTNTNKLFIRNEANNAFIEVATLDQTNNEWQITTGVIQAKDSDGLALKTDDGTTRIFIKDSDGTVGIGTSSPTANLSVAGTVFASTNLGIRTDSPAQNLHVHQDDSDASRAVFTNTTTGTTGNDGFLVGLNSSEQAVIQQRENKDMIFYTNNTPRLTIHSNGAVEATNTIDCKKITFDNFNDGAGDAGLNIIARYSYDDNNTNTIGTSYNQGDNVVYVVTAIGSTSIPMNSNGGGGVAWDIRVYDPDNHDWGSLRALSFTQAGSSPNSFAISFASGTAAGSITRTAGTRAYQVYVSRRHGGT